MEQLPNVSVANTGMLIHCDRSTDISVGYGCEGALE